MRWSFIRRTWQANSTPQISWTSNERRERLNRGRGFGAERYPTPRQDEAPGLSRRRKSHARPAIGSAAVLCARVVVKHAGTLTRPERAVAGVLSLKRRLARQKGLHDGTCDIVAAVDAPRVAAGNEEERGGAGNHDVAYVFGATGAVGIGPLFDREPKLLKLGNRRAEAGRLVFALASFCESQRRGALLSEVGHS